MSRIIFAVLLVAVPPAALAQLYKCVDARGKTVYADKPLPGCKGAPVRGEAPPAQPGKAAGKGKARDPFVERNRIVREQAVRCSQALQAHKRGDESDSVRATLRGCM